MTPSIPESGKHQQQQKPFNIYVHIYIHIYIYIYKPLSRTRQSRRADTPLETKTPRVEAVGMPTTEDSHSELPSEARAALSGSASPAFEQSSCCRSVVTLFALGWRRPVLGHPDRTASRAPSWCRPSSDLSLPLVRSSAMNLFVLSATRGISAVPRL